MTGMKSSFAKWGMGESSCVCEEVDVHPPYEGQITEILEEISFIKIEAVMQQLSWKTQPTGKVPTIDELKASAKSFLEDVAERGPSSWSGSAGFHAENNYGYLRLAFEVDSWATNA
jgi:hypothetical protein